MQQFPPTETLTLSPQIVQNGHRSTPSSVKRKKIFESSPSDRLTYDPPPTAHINRNTESIESRIQTVIGNLTYKLESCEHVKAQNNHLRQENSRLRELIDENVENELIRREKEELGSKVFDLKKRIYKAKLILELMQSQDHQKEIKELLELFDI